MANQRTNAGQRAVLHLRHLSSGTLFQTYARSFDRVWDQTRKSWNGEKVIEKPKRIDYLNDPNAPQANSLIPSANVIVVNDQGEILLIRRTDNNWAVPGGGMDLGESITETAVREAREETGIECEITGLVRIYTNPRHVILYTSNGEVRQEFSIVFTARPIGGDLRPSSESVEPQRVSPAATETLPINPSMCQRIQHYLDGRAEPYVG